LGKARHHRQQPERAGADAGRRGRRRAGRMPAAPGERSAARSGGGGSGCSSEELADPEAVADGR